MKGFKNSFKTTKAVKPKKMIASTKKTFSMAEEPHFVKELNKKTKLKTSHHILHWNVNGIRAAIKKEIFRDFILENDFDIICLNETKINHEKLMQSKVHEDTLWQGYHQYWHFSTRRKGYSGCAIFSKEKPLSYSFGLGHERFDSEGRTVTLEFQNFYVVSAYAPSISDNFDEAIVAMRNEVWETAFQNHLLKLREKKHVVMAADLNAPSQDIDIIRKYRKKWVKILERGMEIFQEFLEKGFTDVFREMNPGKEQFTSWCTKYSARDINQGWRLDFFIVDDRCFKYVKKMVIRDQVMASDHCPLEMLIDFSKK